MIVVWPCHWYGDYKVPVFTNLNRLLDGGLMVFYSKKIVTESVVRKMETLLPNNSEGLLEKTLIIGKKHNTTMANKRLFLRFQPDLYKKLCSINPDIVIAETFGGWSPISIFYAVTHRKKLMMFYERTAYVERNARRIQVLYRKLIGRFVNHFLINGTLTHQYLDSLGFKDIPKTEGLMVSDTTGLACSIASITKEQKTELAAHLLLKHNGLSYLFIGQIVMRKGIKELCEAWEQHILKHPNDTLIVAGTGVLLDELREKYTSLNSIRFLGQIEYDDIYKYYAVADVFIMPTMEDNWCLVIPEAMACGKPVACSIYNGGHVELVKDGENGYNFDPLKQGDILAVLEKFHKADLLAFGQRSKQIVSEYTPEKAAYKIFEACKSVMRN